MERWPDKSLGRSLPPGFREIEDLYLELPPVMDSGSALIRARRTSVTSTMQGVEYLMQAATGEDRFSFTPEVIHQAMGYATRENELQKFPQLWDLLKEKLSALPKGSEVLDIVTSDEKYELA